jgi:hypothetical protein
MRFIQRELGGQDAIVIYKHGDANTVWVFMSADEAPAVIGYLSFHGFILSLYHEGAQRKNL